ncbi:hypothetical protein Ancab_023660 [Ancistrocladus abbreviatus]
MDAKQGTISVLMLPWLAHGHISPFLELAKKLTKRNFFIYFCSSSINLASIKKNIGQKYSLSIELVELHLPSLIDLPPHHHTTNGLPPHLMSTLKQAFDMSANPNFSDILRTLRPNLVIYDFLQPWAPALAASFDIPAIEFLTINACMTYFSNNFLRDYGAGFPFSEIYLTDFERTKFAELGLEVLLECMRRSLSIILIKSFREIEGKYLNQLNASMDKKVIPVGPLIQEPLEEEDESSLRILIYIEENDHMSFYSNTTLCFSNIPEYQILECNSQGSLDDIRACLPPHIKYNFSINIQLIEVIRWLDMKEKMSTVFVSFGSEYFLSSEEVQEIAHGLELSNVNFIWVVRFPNGGPRSIKDELPEGFLKRVRGRGLVVEGWAPQMKLLGHTSIGGFVSHCGWSSLMESMSLGVPIIAMPMHLDQPINARLVASLGVGVEVKRDYDGRFGREEVANVIRKVLVENDGENVREKAKELSGVMVNKGDEEIDEVVDELVKIYKENKHCSESHCRS